MELSDRTAAALVIGNELLSGKVEEKNLVVLARTLRNLGVELARVVMLADEVAEIASEVRVLSSTFDCLFTSGGVGPTHDDVTVEAVARAFGLEVVSHPTLEAMLRRHYGERCTEGHLRMALVPRGAELVASDEVPWPSIMVKNVWILPGIPEVFRMKMSHVSARLRGGRPFHTKAVYTRLDEGQLKPMLDRVVVAHPRVTVGSYPKWQDLTYKTKLTFDGRDATEIEAAVADFVATLPEGEPQGVE